MDDDLLEAAEIAIKLAAGSAGVDEDLPVSDAVDWLQAAHDLLTRCSELAQRVETERRSEEAAIIGRYCEAHAALQILRQLAELIVSRAEGTRVAADEELVDWQSEVLRRIFRTGLMVSGEIAALLRAGYPVGAMVWGAKTRSCVGSGCFALCELVVSLALSTMGGAGAGVVRVLDVRAGDGARAAVSSLVGFQGA